MPRCRSAQPAAAIVAVLIIAYGATLTIGFIDDDFVWIRDTRVTWLALPSVLWRHTTLGEVFFRPLANLVFALDGLVWPMWPPGYRITNLVLHGVNGWLLFRVAAHVLDDRTTAVAATVLFLLRPTHVDAVTWISGRTELLAAAGTLGALAFHGGVIRGGTAAAAVAFALGLAAKENAAVFLPLAAGFDLIGGRRLALRRYGAYLALFAVYACLRLLSVQKAAAGMVGFDPSLRAPLSALPAVAIAKCDALAPLLFMPLSPPGAVLWGGALLWLAILLIPAARRRLRGASLAGLLLFAPLLPHLLFWFTQARYAYLPSTGVSLGVVLALQRAGDRVAHGRRYWLRRMLLWGGAAVVALSSAQLLSQQNAALRASGQMSADLLSETRRLVAAPPKGSVLHYFGVRQLRQHGAWDKPPTAYGFNAAVQLTFDDPRLDVDLTENRNRLRLPLPAPGRRFGLRAQWRDGHVHLSPVSEPERRRHTSQ